MIPFDLLRVAIGISDGSSLFVSAEEWQEFFLFCKKQALLGIGFSAVEKIGTCPKSLMLTWYGIVMQIQKRNLVMTQACKDVSEAFGKDGFRTCVLKGQGNLINYPEHLKNRRQSGDIDLWTSPMNGGNVEKQVIDYVRSKGTTQVGPNYLHIDMVWNGNIEVEVHYRPRFLVSPLRNHRIQKWANRVKDLCMSNMTKEGFAVPPTAVNVVYQMAHLFGHYFDEGLGMRQIVDYYFVLKDLNTNVPDTECQRIKSVVLNDMKHFGFAKFASAMMWVFSEVFAMPAEWAICKANAKEGNKLLDEILLAGNFGKYDERGKGMKNGGMLRHGIWKLKRIMRLVSSYPETALWEPWFRVWHFFWRLVHKAN